MSTAQNILIAYGVIVATYALLLGIPLAAARMKAPAASRHLVNAHLEGLMQSPLHLGLAFAIGAAGFDSGAATVAAWLLVAGSAMGALGNTANWIQDTGDQFAERSPGFILNAASAWFIIPGAGIITVGVLTGL